MIDRLLEKKPISQFQGELIYKFEDVHRFIDLMPKPNEQGKNPIFTDGTLQNE